MGEKTRKIKIGDVEIGGGAPVSVQSMAKTDTRDVEATVAQIRRLEEAGCEIIRVAVPDRAAADAIARIKRRIGIPLVADIHFDYRLAIAALEAGADGLRINPGNIGADWKVRELASAAAARSVPIRVGANSGSISKRLLRKHGGPTAEALVESALAEISVLERAGFDAIKVSVKAADVMTTVRANRMISQKIDYPLHIGVTEAGPPDIGIVKSAIGIGILLSEAIGDTIRVSLTGDPAKEVRAGWRILGALGIRRRGVDLVSCPVCGRCRVDLVRMAKEVEEGLAGVKEPVKVAVMGCEVNGPGEAMDADYGIAFGRSGAAIFKKGRVVARVSGDGAVRTFIEEVLKDLK